MMQGRRFRTWCGQPAGMSTHSCSCCSKCQQDTWGAGGVRCSGLWVKERLVYLIGTAVAEAWQTVSCKTLD